MEIDNDLLHSGTSGISGVSGHIDFCGYGRVRTWDENTPKMLVEIFKFRNESIHKEWMGSLEYPTSSATAEEHNIKVDNINRRVMRKLNEITERYKKLDDALDELEFYLKHIS